MKSATIAATILASVAAAQPHGHQRRQHQHQHLHQRGMEIVTEVETMWVTATVMVGPSETTTIVPSQASSSLESSPTTLAQVVSPTTLAQVAAPTTTSTPTPVALPSTTEEAVVSVAPTTTYAPAPLPSTTEEPASPAAPTTTSTPVAVATTVAAVATAAATPASTSSSGSANALSGEMTYYTLGLGACGWDDSGKDNSENYVALGHSYFYAVSKLTSYGINLPANPLCGKTITIKSATTGKTTTATVRDSCPGCSGDGIDVSESVFKDLMGSTDAGRVDITWWMSS